MKDKGQWRLDEYQARLLKALDNFRLPGAADSDNRDSRDWEPLSDQATASEIRIRLPKSYEPRQDKLDAG